MITVPVILETGARAGTLQIECTEPRGRGVDTVNGYRVAVRDGDDGPTRIATFQHRYGDGWLALLRRALESLEGHH